MGKNYCEEKGVEGGGHADRFQNLVLFGSIESEKEPTERPLTVYSRLPMLSCLKIKPTFAAAGQYVVWRVLRQVRRKTSFGRGYPTK